MKTKTKQLTVIIALLLLCTIVLSCAYGCTGKNPDRFDTELFSCMYNKDKTGVIILELTKKGQEQEILVIPEEINGLPVVQLGGTTNGYPYQSHHYIKSSLLKKIYFNNSNYLDIERFDISQPLEIIAMYDNCYFQTVSRGNRFGNKFSCYTTEKIYNDNVENLLNRSPLSQNAFSVVSVANMYFFEVTNTEERIIWIDHISEGGIYYCPYSDREWYLDKEYTTVWDERFILPEGKTELLLYAKWEKE